MSRPDERSMRAAIIQSVGGLPAVADRPVPRPGAGEALIRISAASLNPVDAHIAGGQFFDGPPVTPYVPGLEGIGIVEHGTTLPPGTRVRVEVVHPGYGREGTLAEYVCVPEAADDSSRASQTQVLPLGDGLSDVDLAAIGGPGCTALGLLDRVREVGGSIEGATVMVLAATGSVGSLAVQLAKRLGAARVIGAARDEGRLQGLVEMGADATVHLDDDEEVLRSRFIDAAQGRLDVVIEPLWGTPARAAIRALTRDGVLVNFGNLTGPEAPMTALPLRNQRITLTGYSGAWTTPDQRRTTFHRLIELTSDAPLRLAVEELSLDEVAAAWPHLKSGSGTKYVVRPAPSAGASSS